MEGGKKVHPAVVVSFREPIPNPKRFCGKISIIFIDLTFGSSRKNVASFCLGVLFSYMIFRGFAVGAFGMPKEVAEVSRALECA